MCPSLLYDSKWYYNVIPIPKLDIFTSHNDTSQVAQLNFTGRDVMIEACLQAFAVEDAAAS
jgi:hypothetical protein